MATATKITRVSNPRRTRRRRNTTPRTKSGRFIKRKRVTVRTKRRKRNPSSRMGAPRIRRYSAKTLRKELKRRGVNTSPRRSHRRHTRRRINRKRNSPLLIELGAINPFRGGKKRKVSNVATKRRRRKSANPRRRRRHVTAVARVRRRRSNPHRVYRRRRRNTSTMSVRRRGNRRVRRYSRRRNPAIFGRSSGKDLLMMVGGGLVGVAATKFLPSLIPSTLLASLGSSPIMGVVLTAAGAFAAGWLAQKVSREFGDAVLFGGLMQAGSVLLTAFAPAAVAKQLALSGMGDIVPGWFAVPQNPVTNRAPMMIASASSGGGMGAAIPRAFGRR